MVTLVTEPSIAHWTFRVILQQYTLLIIALIVISNAMSIDVWKLILVSISYSIFVDVHASEKQY